MSCLASWKTRRRVAWANVFAHASGASKDTGKLALAHTTRPEVEECKSVS